jgi:hypothetical protein
LSRARDLDRSSVDAGHRRARLIGLTAAPLEQFALKYIEEKRK